ncbi:MAG: YihA family ribosome biogenesis GTP-binding protein [Burkholderiales bacterium]|nr:YihA family ribosome biogenesis GTP-binding protein [Burkholderiales bacterium]
MTAFDHARLLCTAADLNQLPPESGREVAFAGRSNAGKSSAINTLTRRRRLAYVARQPGKTRTIQLFELAPERLLVDLPGYGYARVGESLRRRWGRLVDAYLAQRAALQGLVLVVDIRHPLTPLDRQLLAWFAPRDLPVHILATKADKISRSQALLALRRIEQWAGTSGMRCSVQLFSSHAGIGVDEARAVIARWLDLPDDRSLREVGSQNKNPRLKGSKAGGKNALIGIKAPAQGGEAGDDETSSTH